MVCVLGQLESIRSLVSAEPMNVQIRQWKVPALLFRILGLVLTSRTYPAHCPTWPDPNWAVWSRRLDCRLMSPANHLKEIISQDVNNVAVRTYRWLIDNLLVFVSQWRLGSVVLNISRRLVLAWLMAINWVGEDFKHAPKDVIVLGCDACRFLFFFVHLICFNL